MTHSELSNRFGDDHHDKPDDIWVILPPPNKKLRLTPIDECTEMDLIPPKVRGNLMPIPPPPKPETKQSINELLAPYTQRVIKKKINNYIQHPRISVTKPTTKGNNKREKLTVYDVSDSCWCLIFHFISYDDLIFNVSATSKFYQQLVVDTSTWIHRKVVLSQKIYDTNLPKLIQDTLETIFMNWTSLKQLDIMLGILINLYLCRKFA